MTTDPFQELLGNAPAAALVGTHAQLAAFDADYVWSAWRRLLDELEPDFYDAVTDAFASPMVVHVLADRVTGLDVRFHTDEDIGDDEGLSVSAVAEVREWRERIGTRRGLRFAVVLNGCYCGAVDLLPNARGKALAVAEAAVRTGGLAAVLGMATPVYVKPSPSRPRAPRTRAPKRRP